MAAAVAEPRVNAGMLAGLEGRAVTMACVVTEAAQGSMTVTAADKKPVSVSLGAATVDAALAAGHHVDVAGTVQGGKIVAVRAPPPLPAPLPRQGAAGRALALAASGRPSATAAALQRLAWRTGDSLCLAAARWGRVAPGTRRRARRLRARACAAAAAAPCGARVTAALAAVPQRDCAEQRCAAFPPGARRPRQQRRLAYARARSAFNLAARRAHHAHLILPSLSPLRRRPLCATSRRRSTSTSTTRRSNSAGLSQRSCKAAGMERG